MFHLYLIDLMKILTPHFSSKMSNLARCAFSSAAPLDHWNEFYVYQTFNLANETHLSSVGTADLSTLSTKTGPTE